MLVGTGGAETVTTLTAGEAETLLASKKARAAGSVRYMFDDLLRMCFSYMCILVMR